MIITKAQLDTIVTIKTLHSNLGDLPNKIVELSGNIIDFNQHVNTLTNALDSYGQTNPELIFNLFKAYKQIKFREFLTYIMVTRFGYNANPIAYQPLTLMEGVENNYKLAVKAGTWSLAKSESNKISALCAEIEAMKVESSKDNRGKRPTQQRAEKYGWKKVAPSEGDPKTKQFEDQTYYWCTKHQAWTMHKDSKCNGIQ
jgi:hypothetical protein